MQLSKAYFFDAQVGFWRRPKLDFFAYTDGDSVEQGILDIVQNCSDLSVFSEELSLAIHDWPTQYHLGRGRINILQPFRQLLKGSVLEIGCGCGAITRALGELGADVLALEGSSVRAKIAATRCNSLDNVTVVCDNFDAFETEKLFDVVTLIGVLEYARQYFSAEAGQDPVAATLSRAHALLKPGGVLLLAIENQLGLKYLAGRPEDHNGVPMYGVEDLYGTTDAVTFGEYELRGLLCTAGWSHQRWWYPFPDYKFPISILSEDGIRTAADLTPLLQNSVSTDPQRGVTSFSLESAWAPVFRNGLAGALANSFAVVASDRPLAEPQALAYHYASTRRQSFAKEVAFVQGEGGRISVQHRPFVPSLVGAAHIENGLTVEFEEVDFVPGQHWQKALVQILNRPGWSLDDLRPWAETWFRAFKKHTVLERDSSLNKDTCIDGNHFDAVPRNLIVRGPDDAVFIDQEWQFKKSLTLGFLVFRSLGLSFFGLTSVAPAAPNYSTALRDILFELANSINIPLAAEDLPIYVEWENELQHCVGNHTSVQLNAALISDWRLDVRVACWNPENIYRLEAKLTLKDQDLTRLGAEIHRLEAMVLSKDERLTEVGRELANFHEMLARKDQDLERQPAEIHRLEALVLSKDERLTEVGRELANFHEMLARKDQDLERQPAEIHRLEALVLSKDERLTEVGRELANIHEMLVRKDHDLERQSAEIHRLETMVLSKDERLTEVGRELANIHEMLARKNRDLERQSAEIHHLEAHHLQQMAALRQEAAEEAHSLRESQARILAQIEAIEQETKVAAQRTEEERLYFYAEVAKRDKLLAEGQASHDKLKCDWQSTTAELQVLKLTRWFQLHEILSSHPFGLNKVLLLAATVGGGLLPQRWRPSLVPRLQRLLGLAPVAPTTKGENQNAYKVKVPPAAPAGATHIVHAIANFMTGGSSRLVIDLVEYLGSQYRQTVLTSFNPDPPAYVGVNIEECRFPQDISPLVAYFQRTKADIVHMHYWGDCDEPWYAKVIEAAEYLGLPVIENINTPIAPYRSDAVVRYVYVSDYVRQVFGSSGPQHVTVYPGSDFSLFTRGQTDTAPNDCVGMVYRLEQDKLNEAAIQPFIRIAQMRPQTRILIVGGGSLYEPYLEAARAAGVADNFEFTGYVSYDKLPELYRRMSLFVAPVWKESFGQVSPFAMSMKVPVIGYDIGAIGEIVGTPDLLAPPADAEVLARIAINLLDSPETIHRLGEAQQRRATENFSIQAMITHYAQIYAEVSEEAQKDLA